MLPCGDSIQAGNLSRIVEIQKEHYENRPQLFSNQATGHGNRPEPLRHPICRAEFSVTDAPPFMQRAVSLQEKRRQLAQRQLGERNHRGSA
jgi:hypothetical protein